MKKLNIFWKKTAKLPSRVIKKPEEEYAKEITKVTTNYHNMQEMHIGRSWKSFELRIKSEQDLHMLWHVLYKEKMALTSDMYHASQTKNKEAYDGYKSCMNKVRVSMARLQTILGERERLRNEFLLMLEFWYVRIHKDNVEEFRRSEIGKAFKDNEISYDLDSDSFEVILNNGAKRRYNRLSEEEKAAKEAKVKEAERAKNKSVDSKKKVKMIEDGEKKEDVNDAGVDQDKKEDKTSKQQQDIKKTKPSNQASSGIKKKLTQKEIKLQPFVAPKDLTTTQSPKSQINQSDNDNTTDSNSTKYTTTTDNKGRKFISVLTPKEAWLSNHLTVRLSSDEILQQYIKNHFLLKRKERRSVVSHIRAIRAKQAKEIVEKEAAAIAYKLSHIKKSNTNPKTPENSINNAI